MTSAALLLGSAAVMALLSVGAFAHAEIESCHPPIGATTAAAPELIVCTTSEAMDPSRSALRVFDSAGARVDTGESTVSSSERTTISVSLQAAKIANGVYTVKWKTLSADDGDEASGEFKFTVAK